MDVLRCECIFFVVVVILCGCGVVGESYDGYGVDGDCCEM